MNDHHNRDVTIVAISSATPRYGSSSRRDLDADRRAENINR